MINLHIQHILWFVYILNLGLVQCLRQLYHPFLEKIVDLHAPGHFVENQNQVEIDGARESHLECLDSH